MGFLVKMGKQLMQYIIKKNEKELKTGILMAEGNSVYDMTEDTVDHLGKLYGIADLEFEDVSNYWTFLGTLNQEPIKLEFAPIDTPADKFGIDEELN